MIYIAANVTTNAVVIVNAVVTVDEIAIFNRKLIYAPTIINFFYLGDVVEPSSVTDNAIAICQR